MAAHPLLTGAPIEPPYLHENNMVSWAPIELHIAFHAVSLPRPDSVCTFKVDPPGRMVTLSGMERLTLAELKGQVEELARYLSENSPSREELEARLELYGKLVVKRDRKAA